MVVCPKRFRFAFKFTHNSVFSYRHDDLKTMLDGSKDNLKLDAMKRIIGVSLRTQQVKAEIYVINKLINYFIPCHRKTHPIRIQESCFIFDSILPNNPIMHHIDCVGLCIFCDINMHSYSKLSHDILWNIPHVYTSAYTLSVLPKKACCIW